MLKNRKKGFTLVEIIVVLVIIAILAAISLPALTGYIKSARLNKAEMAFADMRKGFIAAAANVNVTNLRGGLSITATTKSGTKNEDERLFMEKIQQYLSDYVVKTDPKNPDSKYWMYFTDFPEGGVASVEDLLSTVAIYYYPNGMKNTGEIYTYLDGVITKN